MKSKISVVMVGSPSTGYQLYGPFDSSEAAHEWRDAVGTDLADGEDGVHVVPIEDGSTYGITDSLDEAVHLLIQAQLQIEYLGEKFTKTGTSEQVLAKIKSFTSGARAPKVDDQKQLVKKLADSLEELMGVEGGEPNDDPDSIQVWERAKSVLKLAKNR